MFLEWGSISYTTYPKTEGNFFCHSGFFGQIWYSRNNWFIKESRKNPDVLTTFTRDLETVGINSEIYFFFVYYHSPISYEHHSVSTKRKHLLTNDRQSSARVWYLCRETWKVKIELYLAIFQCNSRFERG